MTEITPRDDDEQRALTDAITDLFEHRICFNEHLGIRVTNLWADSVVTEFAMRPEFVGHFLYGRLHGGVISAVLDSAGGLAVMAAIAKDNPSDSADQIMNRFAYLGTVDMRVDYLRQGTGETFIADAEVLRLGRRIAASRMNLHNEQGSLIATGSAAYIVSGPNSMSRPKSS